MLTVQLLTPTAAQAIMFWQTRTVLLCHCFACIPWHRCTPFCKSIKKQLCRAWTEPVSKYYVRHLDLLFRSCAAAGAGDITDTYFRNNQALNGASVWQNDCKSLTHSGSRFDNNAATQACIPDSHHIAHTLLSSYYVTSLLLYFVNHMGPFLGQIVLYLILSSLLEPVRIWHALLIIGLFARRAALASS